MKTGCVYIIKNIQNGKVYVGSTKNATQRWTAHKNQLRNNRHKNVILQNSWNKHGEDAFVFEVIEDNIDLHFYKAHEQFAIWRYDSCNRSKGYNLQEQVGTGLGLKHTEETKARMSEIAQNRPEGYYDAVSEAQRGRTMPEHVYEHLNSEQTRQKVHRTKKRKYQDDPEFRQMLLDKAALARSYKGPVSEETRAKMTKSQTGRKHSPETMQRLRDVQSNRSSEWRANIAETKRKWHAMRRGEISEEEYVASLTDEQRRKRANKLKRQKKQRQLLTENLVFDF